MEFKFSLKISLICGILASLMLYASYWQYTRYKEKLSYIAELDKRLELPVSSLNSLYSPQTDYKNLLHRKVSIKGTWDYENEIILRNRKLNGVAGVFVITPLQIEGRTERVLVSRGFIPLASSSRQDRIKFRNAPSEEFVALIKEGQTRKLFAPEDEVINKDEQRIDAWLRVDIEKIAKQLPYPIMPFYLELISQDTKVINSNSLLQQKSERDQILFLPGAGASLKSLKDDQTNIQYPIPVFDTIVPAGRHFSYIFEWAIMAGMVIIAGIILQLRRYAGQ